MQIHLLNPWFGSTITLPARRCLVGKGPIWFKLIVLCYQWWSHPDTRKLYCGVKPPLTLFEPLRVVGALVYAVPLHRGLNACHIRLLMVHCWWGDRTILRFIRVKFRLLSPYNAIVNCKATTGVYVSNNPAFSVNTRVKSVVLKRYNYFSPPYHIIVGLIHTLYTDQFQTLNCWIGSITLRPLDRSRSTLIHYCSGVLMCMLNSRSWLTLDFITQYFELLTMCLEDHFF